MFFHNSLPPKETADLMLKTIYEKSCKTWKNHLFRKYVDFKNIKQTDQDRILNELVVTGLVLGNFIVKAAQEQEGLTTETQLKIQELGKTLPQAHLDDPTYNISPENLIELRQTEYLEHVRYTIEEGQESEALRKLDNDLKDIWVRIETLAIGCWHHIRADDKTDPHDPLWKHLRDWLIDLEKQLRKDIKRLKV